MMDRGFGLRIGGIQRMQFSMSHKTSRPLALLLLVAIAGCSKKEDQAAAPASGTAEPTTAATSAPPAPAVSAEVQAMSAEDLRESAASALRENRIYSPGGNNAMEYYLALRDKLPNDPGVTSALTDLLPYTVIAAEQTIAREDFVEAQRLSALIEKTDAKAPALPRLKQSIVAAEQAVAARTVANEARLQAEVQTKAQEQQRLAQQQQEEAAAAVLAQQQQQQQQAQEAARQQAERQAAAQREAEERAQREAAARTAAATPARPPAAAQLRAVSTPAPRYPPEALRAGTSGEVLVELTVGTDGSVTAARVVRAEPARIFDREALNSVRRWKFEPVDAPVTTRRTIAFNPG